MTPTVSVGSRDTARWAAAGDATGRPVVLELQLAEPGLLLSQAPDAVARFVAAVGGALIAGA